MHNIIKKNYNNKKVLLLTQKIYCFELKDVIEKQVFGVKYR